MAKAHQHRLGAYGKCPMFELEKKGQFMTQLVTIFGGSGFVGRYIARRMALRGWRVRVAVRSVAKAQFFENSEFAGQVEIIPCTILEDSPVAKALEGADAVVNCVGILAEHGNNKFDTIQAEGADRIARLAAQAGITNMVQLSAIGADPQSQSEYSKTKAAGETAVMEHIPSAVILRPSIVFGPEDEFFNRFADITRFSPFVPVVSPNTKFQPVYVDDVAAAAEAALSGQAQPGIYELGGPHIATFKSLMHQMLAVMGKKRLVLGLPLTIGKLMGSAGETVNAFTFGIIPTPITMDQARSLATDNVASGQYPGLDDLGITPTPLDQVLPTYLG